MNRDLSLYNSAAKFSLNLLAHFYNRLASHTVENAAVIRGGQQLEVTVPTVLEHENVQDCHFLNVVVEQPKHIIEPIHFSICYRRHERTQVATYAELTVTERPILVHVVRALEANTFLIE